MRGKIAFTLVILAALVGIFILRKPSPTRIDLIPIGTPNNRDFEDFKEELFQQIIINTDTIHTYIDYERFIINKAVFVYKLPLANEQNLKAIKKDYYHPTGMTKEHIDYFINNTDEEQLKKIGLGKPTSENVDKIITNLKLILVTVQAQNDFSKEYDINYIYDITGIDMGEIHLSVTTDVNGGNIEVGWET
ncbi:MULTISPECIES: hypothetical protein [Myroides]|uniref:Uncharacterized protein n=1 Tax=Myroides albus TaxID=2562892 RepID=A0A6I3LKG5_9FLAO|nr:MULTISPECIES: hypothetical protein [Myroides]MTG97001.1 hypothetical protein [Myroides albus]MVX34468.1 hypothetical protein [Myroides sp. LoEW2-1]UVD80508.1 hypothetical protein NWE55_04350 [Myroides albus]